MDVETNNDFKCTMALGFLENVYDPEIGLNVVSLGLIYKIMFNEEKKQIDCTMTLTTQFCPMGESITSNVKNTVQENFKDYTVELILTFEPAWSYDFISEEGKEFLKR
ncbi:MAG: metal-sulfur cluster assembly factor [Bacteroidetes bacterium]|nr:metal-sulfur cluster assembly factor [Bacteroidota bacterium]